MRRWIQAIGLLAAVVILIGGQMVVSHAGQNKSGKSAKTIGKKSTMRGEDAHIKHDSDKNSPNSKAKAPGQKGGKSRGDTAVIHYNNHTRWIIKLYHNGDYVGTAAPYGDNYYYAEPGTHELYATALFEDGSVYTWGPTVAEVESSFEWNLYWQ